MTETPHHSSRPSVLPRRRGLRRALNLVRRSSWKSLRADDVSPCGTKSTVDLSPLSPSRLSVSSLSSSASSCSSSSSSDRTDKSALSQSRKGVTYDVEGAVVCCRFCEIVRDRDAEFLYEDERVAVFRPLAPAVESHVLVVPRCHIRNIDALTVEDTDLLKHMRAVAELVLSQECAESTTSSRSDCKFAFHTPRFNSIDHVHMHAFRTRDRSFGCLGAIKYCTDTWWCQSLDVVLSRVAAKAPQSNPFARPCAMVDTAVSTS